MTLDNGQYFDLLKNYQLVYEYLTSYCGLEPQTLDFAFDTYGLNEETFEDLNERQGLNQFDFEEFLKESWEEYEEEQEEEEEENEEESENMNSLDQNGDC